MLKGQPLESFFIMDRCSSCTLWYIVRELCTSLCMIKWADAMRPFFFMDWCGEWHILRAITGGGHEVGRAVEGSGLLSGRSSQMMCDWVELGCWLEALPRLLTCFLWPWSR